MAETQRIRDLINWPPGVWVSSGAPRTLRDPGIATQENVRINDKGTHLEVLHDDQALSAVIPFEEGPEFNAVALLLLESKGESIKSNSTV